MLINLHDVFTSYLHLSCSQFVNFFFLNGKSIVIKQMNEPHLKKQMELEISALKEENGINNVLF